MSATQRTTTHRNVAVWLGIYLLAVTAPLFALLPGAESTGRGFIWDFAMALGYAAIGMFGIQFALTARFRRATAPFGIDIVYHFHRYLAILALVVVAAHYGLARFDSPALLGSANPLTAAAHMTAGRMALVLFVLIVIVSLVRRRLGWNYDVWRVSHAAAATAAFALAYWHLLGSGHYLDSTWKQALWGGYGAYWLGLIVYVRAIRPWRVSRAPWRVTAVHKDIERVWTLVLEPTKGGSLAFAPGQFAWLSLRSSPFAMREHPFSIASSAERNGRIEICIKELGDFTATIGQIQSGEVAYLDAPYGTFSVDLHPDAPGYVFIVGGIGIAPVLSMLRTLADRADSRPLLLLYRNRSWARIAFREVLDALTDRLNLRIIHVLTEPADGWQGERGFIDRAMLARHLPAESAGFHYFLCGPTQVSAALETDLADMGIAASQIHCELFEWV